MTERDKFAADYMLATTSEAKEFYMALRDMLAEEERRIKFGVCSGVAMMIAGLVLMGVSHWVMGLII